MKKYIVLLVSCLLLFGSKLAAADDFWSTKITHVYSYADSDGVSGWSLIRISDLHNSPEGYLVLPGGLTSSIGRSMLAMALEAKNTQKDCWVRVTPTSTGFWKVNVIQINP